MRRFLRNFLRSDTGSVAPTVGLSLFALIAAGGIAFDYARVAAMDTELQNAADQAALSAATQLDGATGAQTRATSAAQSLITNSTLMANNGGTSVIAVPIVTFFSVYDDITKTPATGDADSNFVQVQVGVKRANYAFTPIVGAFFGQLDAKAVAGLSSAVCGVVPFFICNPTEPIGNTNANLAPGGMGPGTGIVMAEGGTQWGPGNFGFLDQLGNGANSVAAALASNSLLGNCQPTNTVVTQTGNILNAVRDSLNMRFDFKPGNNSSCQSGPCSPSTNVTKDVVLPNNGSNCAWQENPASAAEMGTSTPPKYFPDAPAVASAKTPQIMGYPRDRCHYYVQTSGPNTSYPFCAYGRVGNAQWDIDAYFRSNHPSITWSTEPGLDADGDGTVTRYETYLWEAANPAARLPATGKAGNGAFTQWGQPQSQCLSPGLAPNLNGIDRRRITAAVVNCISVAASTGLNGKKTIPVAGFIDVFLTEPSVDRRRCDTGAGCAGNSTFSYNSSNYQNAYGSRNDIYIEVIGTSGTGQGGAIPQISRRDVPRLIE